MAEDLTGNIVNPPTREDLLAPTHKVQNYDRNEKAEVMADLRNSVDRLTAAVEQLPLSQLLQEASRWTRDLVSIQQEITKNRADKVGGGGDEEKGSIKGGAVGYLKTLSTGFDRFYKEAKNPNTLWFGVSKFGPRAMTQLESLLSRATRPGGAGDVEPASDIAAAATAAATKAMGRVKGGAPVAGGGGPGLLGKVGSGLGFVGNIAKGMGISLLSGMSDMLDLNLGRLAAGAGKNTNDYVEQMRRNIYQTRGASGRDVEYQQQYMRTGEGERIVAEIGVPLDKFREEWLKNMRRGFDLQTDIDNDQFKREKKSFKERIAHEKLMTNRQAGVTKSAIYAAQQMGMGIESVNEMFMDWNQHLGLSSLDMGRISRDLMQISRSTGVTGKNLEAAMKKSEALMKTMKGYGTLDATATKAIINMTAEFEKYGVGEQGQKLLEVLTDPNKFMEGGPSALLASKMAGGDPELQDKLFTGTAMKDIRDRQKMFENMEKEVTGTFKSFMDKDMQAKLKAAMGGKDVTFDTMQEAITALEGMGKEGRDVIKQSNSMMRRAYGADVMDLTRMGQGGKRASRGYEANIDDINEKLKDAGGAMKTQLEEQKDAMQRDFLQQAIESGGDVEALKKSYGDLKADTFKDLPTAVNDFIKLNQKMASGKGMDFDKMLEAESGQNVATIKQWLVSGTDSQKEMAKQAMAAVTRQLETQKQADEDPATKLRLEMDKAAGVVIDFVTGLREAAKEWQIAGLAIASWVIQLGLLAAAAVLAGKALNLIGRGVAGTWRWATGRGGPTAPTPTGGPGTGLPPGGYGGGGVPPGGGGSGTPLRPRRRATTVQGRRNTMTRKQRWDALQQRRAMAGRKRLGARTAWRGMQGKTYSARTKGKGKWGKVLNFGSKIGDWFAKGKDKIMPLGQAGYAAGSAAYAAADQAGYGATGGAGGYGDAQPVYVVNWDEICNCMGSGSAPLGLGGVSTPGGALETAASGLATADMAADAAGLADDVGKAKWFKKLPGVEKAGKLLSKVPGASKVGGVLGKAGGVLGKFGGPLSIALGGVTGALEAEEAGMTKTEGATFGALTGGATTGSMFSGMMGIEKGSNADELVGAYGSMAYGASTGAMIAGPVGAAVGTAVAGGAEVYKVLHNANKEVDAMAERLDKSVAFQADFYQKSIAATKAIENPEEKLKELERKLELKLETQKGQESNLALDKAERAETTNWFGLNPAARALNASIGSGEEQLTLTNEAIEALKNEIAAERAKISSALDITAKTMEQGQKKGSIFVHDTHVEALLIMMLKHMGGWNKNSEGQYNELQGSLQAKATGEGGGKLIDSMVGTVDKMVTGTGLRIPEAVADNISSAVAAMSSGGGIAKLFEAYKGRKSTTYAGTSTSLDYTDETDKPQVSTAMYSPDAAEDFIQRQKLGESGGASVALLPSMDSIAEYLIKVQSDKLDRMIEELVGIRQNTAQGSQSSIVGSADPIAGIISRSGVRRAANGLMKGSWGLQPGAYAQNDIMTDRGSV